MPALGSTLLTLADVSKSKNKEIGKVAEVLLNQNHMLKDIPYMEMNGGTIHTEDIRSALPEVCYRKANQPVPPSKSTIEERTFTAAHFESKSQVDQAVAERGGMDRVAYNRWNQAQGHLQAHANELADLVIYGSPVSSNRKTAGLFDILSTLDPAEETSKQIIDAGGTGVDNTSMILVHWGEQSVFGIYPKGTQSGLRRVDHSMGGKLIKIPGLDEFGNVGDFWGYEEQFLTDHGIVVKDFRQVARIANIDVSDLVAGTGADLIDLMISADHLIENSSNGQGIWYVNRTIEAALHKSAISKVTAGAGLTFDNYQGERVLHFLDKPVRRMDALVTSESQVTV